MTGALVRFSKGPANGAGTGGGGPNAGQMEKAANAVKNALEKFDKRATVKEENGTALKVSASQSLRGMQGDPDALGKDWNHNVMNAINAGLSACGLCGASVEHAGEVKYGPGIGVPMGERAYWSASFTVKLPL